MCEACTNCSTLQIECGNVVTSSEANSCLDVCIIASPVVQTVVAQPKLLQEFQVTHGGWDACEQVVRAIQALHFLEVALWRECEKQSKRISLMQSGARLLTQQAYTHRSSVLSSFHSL